MLIGEFLTGVGRDRGSVLEPNLGRTVSAPFCPGEGKTVLERCQAEQPYLSQTLKYQNHLRVRNVICCWEGGTFELIISSWTSRRSRGRSTYTAVQAGIGTWKCSEKPIWIKLPVADFMRGEADDLHGYKQPPRSWEL
jgi:hypothetical protein